MYNSYTSSETLDRLNILFNQRDVDIDKRVNYLPDSPVIEESSNNTKLTQDELTKRHGILAYAIY